MTAGFGGLARKVTSFFTGGGGQLDEEAQNPKGSSTPNSNPKMYPNKFPSYFLTPKTLGDYLKSEFGSYNFKIKVSTCPLHGNSYELIVQIVMDFLVFETPNKPLSSVSGRPAAFSPAVALISLPTQSQRAELERLSDSA
jgi:hypothetical protein